MIFRQLLEVETYTYSYLLGDEESKEALLIDPVITKVDQYIQLLNELNLTLNVVVDTHLHADHITGTGHLSRETGCSIYQGLPARSSGVTHTFQDGDIITVGQISLKAIYTPGHTDDSYCFLLDQTQPYWLFTGDTLLIRGTGRTDFQNGSSRQQYNSLFKKLLILPDHTQVFPGHDYNGMTMSTLWEEKRYNPRLQVADCSEYEDLMSSLTLAKPRFMDQAIPANLNCGQ
ncbi:MBL fold metallo-hydrolase [Endozoicomonas numazuensis]|uniref:Zn-dependent hydrolase n=1 Tax=Endozoicomonas numazuensis TaxID=1137799 RepID=A0A081NEY6_9GAMM|nr:MBL fold metallo-hydrolase [Endozoicomonas numazuensis]KEQ17009.1 Zn-dependent hydrolase [Endozoicomonas numazuensis]